MKLLVNPQGIETAYLHGLNTSFQQWGDRDALRWVVERRVGDLSADLLTLEDEGGLLAGSAVTYRPALLRNTRVNVGIMTGSWTSPEARGRGCFARMIEASVELAKGKGAALLLAFVTESNASYRGLRRAGPALFPTHYLVSGEETAAPEPGLAATPVGPDDPQVEAILARRTSPRIGGAHLAYDVAELRAQILGRAGHIEVLLIADRGAAVIETKGDLDRVLLVLPASPDAFADCARALLRRAQEHRRRLFLFTTSPDWRDTCAALGMKASPGWLTALVASEQALVRVFPGASQLPADTCIQLCDPSSPWYVGPWDIQSGERM